MGKAREFARDSVKDAVLGHELPRLYRAAAKEPVDERLVLFVNVKLDDVPDSFTAIMDFIERRYDMDVRFVGLNQAGTGYASYHQRCREFVKLAARAAYIFLEDASDVVSCLPLRPETKVVQLWHGCGAFKKWGLSNAEGKFGPDRAQIERHPYYGNLSLVTVSAPEVEWAYREAMGLEATPHVVRPTGVSRTDVYFDEEFRSASRTALERALPQIAGRKVLLYAPTFRGRAKGATGPDAFDLPFMKERLGSEWALVIRHHPFVKTPPEIPAECRDFAFIAPAQLATDSLMCASDALITDYSSVVFEYSLLARPMLFFAFDIDEYSDWRGFYYDYDEMTPGPVARSTQEVVAYFEDVDAAFDAQMVERFREKFMSACDGHATERICREVIGAPCTEEQIALARARRVSAASGRDENIWLFNAGNAFAGNPKWLFLYIQEHHPEITCYWLCYRKALVERMQGLGYRAFKYGSPEAREICPKAGVYVVEQNKEVFQDYLEGIVVLNLWHGVTFKKLEHAVTEGYMEEGLVAKHIRNERVYRQELMLVTSPEQERIFCEQCKIAPENVVRAPYPRSFYETDVATFDHDLVGRAGLGPQTKVALYAPTFRDFGRARFFARALPDAEALVRVLEDEDWLLVIKVHPQMEGDFHFEVLKRRYEGNPRLLFWDNDDDIYEVMDRIDMAIVDYSSIVFDLLARGVERIVRYIFDFDDKDNLRDFAADYLQVTCGEVCRDFDALLEAFGRDEPTDPAERARVLDWAFGYANGTSIEDIVVRAREHGAGWSDDLPTLYSFDVFDTVITRNIGAPEGVFSYVQEKMAQSDLAFPAQLVANYVQARVRAEKNCRSFVEGTLELRGDGRTEITFDMTFERLGAQFDLDERQVRALAAWELEAERAASVGVPERIEEVAGLLDAGETVVFVSDMYLPEPFVRELIDAADARLAGVPLFLSSAYGRQKTKKGLFLDVFHALDYRFGRWVHVGDNVKADVQAPAELGIEARRVEPPRTTGVLAEGVARALGAYDGLLVRDLVARRQAACSTVEERFASGYAALCFVPYVYWVLDDAIARGIERLYFISRDGHHLKAIADAIISARKLPVKTGYLFGSRKAWRVPSQIGELDADFFSSFGNFTGVFDFETLVEASAVPEDEFLELFPELGFLKDAGRFDKEERLRIVEVLEGSQKYRERVLEAARQEREVVCEYLRREIDFAERFAFVEFWGRGYTQACHSRLMQAADARAEGSTYYYARSIYPTQGTDVRINFTDNPKSQRAIEYLFANLPYATVAGYKREGAHVVPRVEWIDFDVEVYEALEECLPAFAVEFAQLDFLDAPRTMRALYDFAMDYYSAHQADEEFVRCIAPLKDSMAIRGELVEYAPKLKARDVVELARGGEVETRSKRMSLARTNPLARKALARYERRR